VDLTGKITTVAGNGNFGFAGDNGTALNAQFEGPVSVAVDAVGQLYIADTSNYRVRRVSAGVITTIAGSGAFKFGGDGGPGAQAFLNQPFGVAVDTSGN